MRLDSKCRKRTKFVKLCWFLAELWQKTRKMWLTFCLFLCYENIINFEGYFATTRLKINIFWQNWYVFVILDQDTTFLFYKFFCLCSAKNVFLHFTQNPLDQRFCFLHILKAEDSSFQRAYADFLANFFSSNVFSKELWTHEEKYAESPTACSRSKSS